MSETSKTNRPSGKTRIYLVDDHPLMRQGIAQIISAESDMEVCGEADNAANALNGINSLRPDAAIIDISLGGINGIELIKNLRALHRDLPILVLSMHDENVYARRALRAGALGYLMKQVAGKNVIEALRKILIGEIYVSEEVGSQLLQQILTGRTRPEASPIERLSDRELEVVQAIGEGKPTREIAKQLNISVKTIESHRANIKDKIGLKNASELMRFSVQWVEQQSGR